MNYGAIKNCDIANGEGIRVTLFVSGCTHHCKGCFQPQTWDFDYGEAFTEETEKELLGMLEPAFVKGLTLLGGEPFEPENQRVLLPFLKKVKEAFPEKNIWAYSGFTYEQLTGESRAHCECTEPMLALCDVLVDGPFVEEKRNLMIRFRGSSNQRLIDLDRTREAGQVVTFE